LNLKQVVHTVTTEL